jgi:3D (Asp-Asp-Asp) domain-containing protein
MFKFWNDLSKTEDVLEKNQEVLLKTEQSVLDVQEVNDSLADHLAQTREELSGTKATLTNLEATAVKINKEKKALQEKNEAIRKQLESKDTEIQKLKSAPPKVIYQEVSRKQSTSQPTVQVASVQQTSTKRTVSAQPTQVSRSTSSEGKTIRVSATAYTAYCNGCSGITRTGIDLRKNPNLKVIAVDPSVIPLGTKVYIEGYGYAIAGDTGGAIKGHKIDIFMPSQSNAMKFGRKTINIKIIK